jgi:hypothetical protein
MILRDLLRVLSISRWIRNADGYRPNDAVLPPADLQIDDEFEETQPEPWILNSPNDSRSNRH